jgi:hypothetical protein
MTEYRQVELSRLGARTVDGAGVRLRRIFGYHDVPRFDPFLMLDDFSGDDPSEYSAGFPWHPHRGFETITYMLRGSAEHQDSLGNKGVIGPGDIQWMTAGSGIIHQEMPKGDPEGRMHGFQLWSNLPGSRKMMDPRYQGILAGEIPEVTVSIGVRVKVVAGKVGDTVGPVRDIVTEPEYLDVSMEPHSRMEHRVDPSHNVFAYIYDGKAHLSGKGPFEKGYIVLFGKGDTILAESMEEGARFILVSGRPLKEKVAWGGSIVMSTREELAEAYGELDMGTFVKVGRTED